jgi:hypothetical protein
MILILEVAGLTSPSIGAAEVEQLRRWRLVIAHDYRCFNSLSQQYNHRRALVMAIEHCTRPQVLQFTVTAI